MYTTRLSTLISSLSFDHHLYADDTQIFFSFHPLNFDSSTSHVQNALQHISSWMSANVFTLNSSKIEFLLSGLKNQLAKIHNSSLDTSYSSQNIGFIFDEHLTFSDQIRSLSKTCYYHIHYLRCIRPYFDSSTACTVATSIVHSKLDHSNSVYYKLPKSQSSRLQQILNSLVRTVDKATKSCHITLILRSLHWLRITERVEYKLLSLTYKVLTTTQPPYLHNLISIQRPHSTRSSSVITLARPPSSSSLKITDRSFRYA